MSGMIGKTRADYAAAHAQGLMPFHVAQRVLDRSSPGEGAVARVTLAGRVYDLLPHDDGRPGFRAVRVDPDAALRKLQALHDDIAAALASGVPAAALQQDVAPLDPDTIGVDR